MKIFILPTSYPSKNHPQKDIFIYEQAKQLRAMGHQIVVLHIEKLPSKQLFSKPDGRIIEENDGFAVRYSVKQKTLAESRFPILSRSTFVRNAEMLYEYAVGKCGRPDVIYAHFSQWAGYAGTLIAKKHQIPLVTLEHYSGLMRPYLPRTLKNCIKHTIEGSDYFICVSERLKLSIEKKITSKKDIYVISNMIDQGFVYQPPKIHSGFVFSAIGRLTEQKNYPMLIRAFVNIFPPEENVVLRIGGDGELRKSLEKLVKNANRQHQILFLGNLTREETIQEYINCDCFALASGWETFGLVYREALAVGRPIVTTDHGGFSEADWHDDYGYMVGIDEINAFSRALKNIRENHKKFDGVRISSLCLADCSPSIIGKKIEYYLEKARG